MVVRDDVPAKSHGKDAYDCRIVSGSALFSPDSKRLAFVARDDDDKWKVFIDEKPVFDFGVNEYTIPIFPPDERIAYVARIGTNSSVVLDGIVGKTFERILTSLTFSLSGKHLAYAGQREGKSVPILDGFEGKEYDEILTCEPFLNTMGVDGPRNVGFAFDNRNALHAIALRGDEIFRLEIQIIEE